MYQIHCVGFAFLRFAVRDADAIFIVSLVFIPYD